MFTGLLHTHSALRWALLIFLVFGFARSLMGWMQKREFGRMEDNFSKLALIFAHIQLLVGFGLYFISPIVKAGLDDMGAAMKEPQLRFWTVEHVLAMVIAIALITIGRVRAKKATDAVVKHKNIAIFFGIALVLILARIPWDRL